MNLIEILNEEVNKVIISYGGLEDRNRSVVKNLFRIEGLDTSELNKDERIEQICDKIEKIKKKGRGNKIRFDDIVRTSSRNDAIVSGGFFACYDIITYLGLADRGLAKVVGEIKKDVGCVFPLILTNGGISLKYIKGCLFPLYERFLADVSNDKEILRLNIYEKFLALVRKTENNLKNSYYKVLELIGDIDFKIPSDATAILNQEKVYDLNELFNKKNRIVWDKLSTPLRRLEYTNKTVEIFTLVQEIDMLRRAYMRFKEESYKIF